MGVEERRKRYTPAIFFCVWYTPGTSNNTAHLLGLGVLASLLGRHLSVSLPLRSGGLVHVLDDIAQKLVKLLRVTRPLAGDVLSILHLCLVLGNKRNQLARAPVRLDAPIADEVGRLVQGGRQISKGLCLVTIPSKVNTLRHNLRLERSKHELQSCTATAR